MISLFLESDNMSIGSTASRTAHHNFSRAEGKASAIHTSSQAGQLSATESSRGDDVHDETDSERSSTYGKESVLPLLLCDIVVPLGFSAVISLC